MQKVGKQQLHERFEKAAMAPYIEALQVMKGVTWLLIATGLVVVWFAFQGTIRLERLVFFASTIVVSFIPIVTYARGLLFHSLRYNTRDEVLPMLMTVWMILLFVGQVLNTPMAEQYGMPQSLVDLPWNQVWFVLVGLHATTAVLLINNRLKLLKDEDFELEYADMVQLYRTQIARDRYGAAVFAVLNFMIFGALASPWANAWLVRWMGEITDEVTWPTVASALIGLMSLMIILNAVLGRDRLLAEFRKVP